MVKILDGVFEHIITRRLFLHFLIEMPGSLLVELFQLFISGIAQNLSHVSKNTIDLNIQIVVNI